MHYKLLEKLRVKGNRKPHPSVIIIDSQSTRTGKLASSATRGYDGGKLIKGRKRHFAVDTNGLLVDVSVTPANVHDNKGARKLLSKIIRRRAAFCAVESVYADKGYRGKKFSDWVDENLVASVNIGENHAKVAKKFIPAKNRWVVERSFSWIRDYRRLTEDMERFLKNSVTMIRLAFIRVMLRQLRPSAKQWVRST
jgi:putative transposase